MDNDTIDLNESMVDLIERAEAFLSAHATLVNRTPPEQTTSRRNHSSSSSNMFESSVEEQESFNTAAEESPGSSRQGSSHATASTSSGRSSNDQPSQIELLTDDDSSGDDELNDSNSTIPYEVDVPDAVPYVPPPADTDADDCVFVSSVMVPTIDLCSPAFEDDNEPPETPRTRQNRLRRAAEAAPIVDLITLDDTISEQPAPPPTRRRQPPVADNDRPDAKRPKSSEPELDLSQSSDGGAPARSVVCPICYDSIFKKQASSTVCGHLFCFACIKQEIQLRQKCPLCKRKLARSQIHPIYFN
uniref:E3 ubiquitin-protein ligase RNF4 n=2 Tax=Culex pipiens TaxID=7175 RepID=A0A8D8BTV8_CULPI